MSNVNMDFMVVMCEMSVMFYDHYITKKLVSFESYSEKVCIILEAPDTLTDNYYNASYKQLLIFLMLELETQYGIVGDRATKIIIDFYTNGYWVGIYNSQSKVNKHLLVRGYYNQLKKDYR